jgi:LDH2 family malate/lactate/ureidoglycolate dehydrogenase
MPVCPGRPQTLASRLTFDMPQSAIAYGVVSDLPSAGVNTPRTLPLEPRNRPTLGNLPGVMSSRKIL